MKNQEYAKISKKLQSGFFGFWVKNRRFTFIVIALIIFGGLYSVSTIPKESTPEIEFGVLSINTVYQGATPQDIDNLITNKIEKEIKDIDGISKITSTSRASISSIVIEFKNDIDVAKATLDVKEKLDKISLPIDAEDPSVVDISFNNEMMFSVLVYPKNEDLSSFYIKEKARKLKANLEGKGKINRIDFDASMDMNIGNIAGESDGFYEIQVLLNKEKVEELGLSINQIAQTIKARNINQPIGTHKVGSLGYDFRIQGEIKNIQELGETTIQTRNGNIKLKDISTIEKALKSKKTQKLGSFGNSGSNYISLFFNKQKGDNIFSSAKSAKTELEKEFQKTEYDGLSYIITLDLAEMINEDYNTLAKNGLQTLILVFLALLIFVGLKESIIATTTIPLAFFITFIVLKNMGLTLNFLTNFSFIITFGIAIDTTIVVIEGAHEKIRQGFNPLNAILLAVKEYKKPLIAGTATTIVVFIPLLSLPGIMGKFLAYIPITIFSTLVAALLISLTINSALYYKLSKTKKYFNSSIGDIKYLKDDTKVLLEEDKKGKIELPENKKNKREEFLDKISTLYSEYLGKLIKNPKNRILSILIPIGAVLASFFVISPFLGFELFPANDNGYISINIKSESNKNQEYMLNHNKILENILSKQKEIKVYYTVINNNTIDTNIELIPKKERKRLKNSLEIESYLDKELNILRSEGLDVSVKAQSDGPPSTTPVGIKIITDNIKNIDTLKQVSLDFQNFLKTIPGTKNIQSSSNQNPGQFVYTFDKAKMSILGLDPTNIRFEIFSIANGVSAGAIKGEYDDHSIKLYYKQTKDNINPQTINNTKINTNQGAITFDNITNYSFEQSINSIDRENNKILISIGSETDGKTKSSTIQSQLENFAKEYNYPDGVYYSMGGESAENMDLIRAIVIAFAISVLSIFGILVLQFNSYSQPAIILYSIIIAILGANIGLFITGQSYGLMFGIGFVALTGIVVNDAIVLLDRANNNIKKGMDKLRAIKEAGKARLQPIILTTITTFFGLISIVSDPMRKPLAITIMVGIIFGSAATLFIIPNIYFDKEKLKHIFRRTILKYTIYLLLPFIISLGTIFILFMFGTNISGIFGRLFVAIFIGFNIWYGFYNIYAISNNGQTLIQKFLGISILNSNGSIMTEKQATKRIFVSLVLTLGPILIGFLTYGIFGLISSSLGSIFMILIVFGGYGYIINKSMLSIRTSEKNISWTDKICNTITIDKKIIKD